MTRSTALMLTTALVVLSGIAPAQAKDRLFIEATSYLHLSRTTIDTRQMALWAGARVGLKLALDRDSQHSIIPSLGFHYATSGPSTDDPGNTSVVNVGGQDFACDLLATYRLRLKLSKNWSINPFLGGGLLVTVHTVSLHVDADDRALTATKLGGEVVGGVGFAWRMLFMRVEFGGTFVDHDRGFLVGGGLGVAL